MCRYYNVSDGICKKHSDTNVTNYCHDGPCPDETQQTQFDHLRSMSDEGLVKFLNDKDCPPTACRVTNGIAIHSECETCWLEWGRSPYKEDV